MAGADPERRQSSRLRPWTALGLAVACCAAPRPSTQPLGGTPSALAGEPHYDRRAPEEIASADAGAPEKPDADPPPDSPKAPPVAASAEPAQAVAADTSGVVFKYTPLKVGDTLRTTLDLGATIAVDTAIGGSEMADIEGTSKAKVRVLKATPAQLDELEIEFNEGRMRATFQGSTEDETVSGDKYVVSFAGGTPSARDSKGQAADSSALPSLVFLLGPLVELQARMAQSPPKPIAVGWSDSILVTRFAGVWPAPADVRIGPLDLKLKALSGVAPNQSAQIDLKLPVSLVLPVGNGRADLAGTCNLPPRTMRPMEIALSGPITGSVPTPGMDVRISGHMRARVRYDFAP